MTVLLLGVRVGEQQTRNKSWSRRRSRSRGAITRISSRRSGEETAAE